MNSCCTFGAYGKTPNAKTTPLRTWLFHFGPAGLDAGSNSRRLSLCFSHFPLLLFRKLFLIALKPSLQIGSGFLQLIVVQQSAPQRFEKRARAHVVGELLVGFMRRAFRKGNE